MCIKQNINIHIHTHKHQTQICRVSPFSIAPVKEKHVRLGHAGIDDPSVELSISDKKNIKKKRKKRMDKSSKIFKVFDSNQCLMTVCYTYHQPTNSSYGW